MLRLSNYQLLIPSHTFRATLRSLVESPKKIAVGRLRLCHHESEFALTPVELDLMESSIHGDQFGGLENWIVLAMADSNQTNPDEWLARLRPLFGQKLVVLLFHQKGSASEWSGWLFEKGMKFILKSFQVVGEKPLNIGSSSPSEFEFYTESDERYAHTVDAVGSVAMGKIRSASVGLVGCSRSGTLAATMLASLGVRKLTLIDGDEVELHNFDGMFLLEESDIGGNKAKQTGRRLSQFRSQMAITIIDSPLGQRIADNSLHDAQLLVTCVDDDTARARASIIAKRQLIPHLDIASSVNVAAGHKQVSADVRFLLPTAGCIRCVGGLADAARVDAELALPPGAIPPFRKPKFSDGHRLGSLITLNAAAVSTGIQSWIDYLNGVLTSSIWHRMLWGPPLGWSIESAEVSAAVDCLQCRGKNG